MYLWAERSLIPIYFTAHFIFNAYNAVPTAKPIIHITEMVGFYYTFVILSQ